MKTDIDIINRCWKIYAMWLRVTTGRWIDVKPTRRLSSAVCLCLEVRFDLLFPPKISISFF